MYFDYNHIKEEVTSSWSRCLRYNRKREIDTTVLRESTPNKKYIDNSIKKYFKIKVEEINNRLEENPCFFLVNKDFIVEEISTDFNKKIKLEQIGIKKGFSFSDEKAGTNAVFLAGKLKEPVHILPGHHFCKPLNSWHSIAYPILIKQETYGFLNIVDQIKIKKEIICLAELLVNNIELNISNKNFGDNKLSYQKKLSDKQFYILKKIAQGLTEKAIARDLNLSKSTIKYHKKKLFNFFNADSNIEMVVKAFKKGFLTFNEVSF